MHIAYAASEAFPYSKTGGLADVAGVLPHEIVELGHSATLFTPYYRAVKRQQPRAKLVAEGNVQAGAQSFHWTLHRADVVRGGADVYFIGNDELFDRDGIYGTAHGDYEDSCQRFVFFCQAALAAAEALGKPVDVWHCHDWQTALIPVYLRTTHRNNPFHAQPATVFTIHNLAYQGLFWHWDWPILNLPWQHFNWRELEFHGKMNLLKGGITYADILVTASPTYAREIQTKEHGWGLDGVLASRHEDLVGIINGIDRAVWNPGTDALLPAVYSAEQLDGKRVCKEALRKKFGLPDGPAATIGMIGRLFEQKGFDLVAQAIGELLRHDIQLVILGTGREEVQAMLKRMQQEHPLKVGVAFAFDNSLAHLIEAGSDLFLMPSRYEPGGQNQLYSLAYGTPPVVRNVGGLADTVVDATAEHIASGVATGFKFDDFTVPSLVTAVDRALELFQHQPQAWRAMMLAGMAQDWSWRRSATHYADACERAMKKHKKTAGT
jgi:starch synthase